MASLTASGSDAGSSPGKTAGSSSATGGAAASGKRLQSELMQLMVSPDYHHQNGFIKRFPHLWSLQSFRAPKSNLSLHKLHGVSPLSTGTIHE
jgi:hypothetical protein